MKRLLRRLPAIALAALTVSLSSAAAEPLDLAVEPISAFSRADAGMTRFGELTFLGGLVLRSSDRDFGALSGLDVTADGRLVAVADTGAWFTARLVEAEGRLAGLADSAWVPMLDLAGEVDPRKTRSDAESVRLVADGDGFAALVALERINEVRRFSVGDLAPEALAAAVPRPVDLGGAARLRGNRGIETIAVAPPDGPLAGAMVVLSERALDGRGNIAGWVVGGPLAGAFTVVRRDDYDITDGVFAGSDLFILERRFSLLGGAMRVRRLWVGAIAPGAILDGPVVMEAGLAQEVDNMEGIAARRGADGRVILTFVSDDNRSPLQRTLLLQFAWTETLPPLPRPKPVPAG